MDNPEGQVTYHRMFYDGRATYRLWHAWARVAFLSLHGLRWDKVEICHLPVVMKCPSCTAEKVAMIPAANALYRKSI